MLGTMEMWGGDRDFELKENKKLKKILGELGYQW